MRCKHEQTWLQLLAQTQGGIVFFGSPVLLEPGGALGLLELPCAAPYTTYLPAHTATALAGETKRVHMQQTAS